MLHRTQEETDLYNNATYYHEEAKKGLSLHKFSDLTDDYSTLTKGDISERVLLDVESYMWAYCQDVVPLTEVDKTMCRNALYTISSKLEV